LEAEAEIAVGEPLRRRTAEVVAAVRVLGHRSGDAIDPYEARLARPGSRGAAGAGGRTTATPSAQTPSDAL
jgi:hypothetical protein